MRAALKNNLACACGCGGEFLLAAAGAADDRGAAQQPASEPPANAFASAVGRRLTNAATVRDRYLPDLKGVVLRFGDLDLLVAAIDGSWAVVAGRRSSQLLTINLEPHRKHQIKMNAWVAT